MAKAFQAMLERFGIEDKVILIAPFYTG